MAGLHRVLSRSTRARFRPSALPFLFFASLVSAGCAAPVTGSHAAVGAVTSLERPVPYPVFESPGFSRAVARRTRTRTGEPGPRHWQQFAKYTLRADLNPGTGLLRGNATIRYYNRSPDSLRTILVRLYPNLNAPDAMRNRTVPVTEPVHLSRVALDGTVLPALAATDTAAVGYNVNGTVVTLRPRRAVRSGDSTTLAFTWSYPVQPVPNPRTGEDREVFHLAYWYPQVAVYDDVIGWDRDQYLGRAEFYMGYADYDVAITLPAGWLVSATGELTNAHQVLPNPIRERLARAREDDQVVTVVAARERAPGVSTLRGNRLTWRFSARNVRDFAWNASNRYVWNATHALVADSSNPAAVDTVLIHALYRPGTPSWENAAEYARHSLEFLSQALWPYPYPQMTLVEGIITGGMEYPMITLIGAGATPRTPRSLYSVTAHEIAHMWFPMAVGSNERRFTWMDEGLATFLQRDAMADFFPDLPSDSLRVDRYLPLARTGNEVELMRHGDLYDSERARSAAGYDKPSLIFRALRALIGEEQFRGALREYGQRWSNGHPQPWDLFNTFNAAAGRQLDWFWRSWFYENWTLDQAIASVTSDRRDLLVTIEDRGLVPMPVWLAVTRIDGMVELLNIPVEVWLTGRKSYVARVPDGDTVRSLEIDPGRFFPDLDRTNQRWTR
ncbi:MAG TPA: M1 family metallopeptidase [Gemmatimonadaceae bacterium]|nr:M1 family metallopeptidase [Gemmatimonadaceae bacterium]